MAHLSLHQRLLDDGFSPLERAFIEFPQIWVNYKHEHRLMLREGGKEEELSDKAISSFSIEEGKDVIDARPESYDSEEFNKRFVVYVK